MIRISAFLLAFLGLSSLSLHAQVTGISYQAVIMSPDGKALPGKNQASTPLANQEICLKFSFKTGIGTTGVVEYEETHVIETDEYGMVNITLGQGDPVGGTLATFDLIPWISGTKFLEVNLDKTANCANYTMISDQAFTAVPFALYAVNSPPGPQGPPGAAGAAGPQGPVGLSGAAASAADFVDLSTNQTVGGVKTFTSPITGSVTGNAATVTTNANLIGPVTSVGNATAIANGAITNAMLSNTAVANLTGTNSGDQTAATVSSVPAGSISATNVQAAINELDTEKASLASPTFTGTPSLPTGSIAVTQAPANNSTALATTAYVDNAASTVVTAASTAILGTAGILPVSKGGTGASTLTGYVKGNGTATMTATATIPVADVVGAAPLASPIFTGTPELPTGTKAITQAPANNSTALATTAYVDNATSTAVLTGATGLPLATGVTGILPVTNGGTGASTQNFVDLSTNQTIAGIKTFSSTIVGSVTGNAETVTTNADLLGPVTSSGNNTAIANGAITNAMLANDAITTLKIANAAVTNDKIAAGINATKLADGSVTNTALQFIGTLTSNAQDQINALTSAGTSTSTAISTNTTNIATNTSDIIQLKNLENGKIYVGNVSDIASEVAVSGDLTLSNTGAATIATDAVTTTKIADANVTNQKLDKANIPLSGFKQAEASVDLGDNKLINVADPTAAQDAATKKYVDDALLPKTYSIGPSSELGGYVFYITDKIDTNGNGVIDVNDNKGRHGLVAATQDQGKFNGIDAEDEISKAGNHNSNGQKYTDWRLPTRYELKLLFDASGSIGNFASMDWYWSSTFTDIGRLHIRQFGNPGDNISDRDWDNQGNIRAVRSF